MTKGQRSIGWFAMTIASIGSITTAAAADTTIVEPFTGGSNNGGWTYGGPTGTIEPAGGNPGAYFHESFIDTFAPQPRTTSGGDFVGDYRKRGVTSVGIDLITLDVDFSAADRPLSVLLVSNNGTPSNPNDDWAAYTLGPDVPVPGQGWLSYDFAIPSQSISLPPQWDTIAFGPGSPANPDWNDVITNVSQLRFFYGDPTFFFIFQVWNVGLDNPRLTEAGVPGDANGDGIVDVQDLVQVITDWGACGPSGAGTCASDLNGDGLVDVADLVLVILNWS